MKREEHIRPSGLPSKILLRRVGGEQGEVGGPEGRSISKLLTVQSWDLSSYTQIKSGNNIECSSKPCYPSTGTLKSLWFAGQPVQPS